MQRSEPAANMQILTAAYGRENVMVCRPSELRDVGPTVAAEEDCLAGAPEWVAEVQANEQSKIFVAVCRGFVTAWRLASRPITILPIPLPRAATRVYFVIQNKLKESAKKKAV